MTVRQAPVITIFVRHGFVDGKLCKYADDEQYKRCNCRKHLRWFANGKQQTRTAKTRSWAEAENVKRELGDQLSGKTTDEQVAEQSVKTISTAVEAFNAEKQVEGVSDGVLKAYKRLTERLNTFAESRGVYTVKGITRELLTSFVATWPNLFPSSFTRVARRQQLRAFLNYCYQSQWLVRVPPVVKMTPDDSPTLPLTAYEYKRLTDAVWVTIGYGDTKRQTTKNGGGRWQYPDASKWQHAVYAYMQLMQWTGLAPIDAMTLRRDAMTFDAAKGLLSR